VKTSTSKKPICEQPIIGLTYIDDQALEGIRRRAKGLVSHRDLEDMLAEIGEILGFYVKREESTTDGLHRVKVKTYCSIL